MFVLLAIVAELHGVACAQAAPPNIAVILPKKPDHLAVIYNSFLAKFNQVAANQHNPHFYVQTPNDDYLSLRNSARKAIALNADLILAFGTSAALAAKSESFETPILFADAIEPEAIGLVTQNKRDSQLATGVRGNAPLQTLFKLLREMTNTLNLALILDGDHNDKLLTSVFVDTAARRGIQVVPINVKGRSPSAVVQSLVDRDFHALMFFEEEQGNQEIIRLALERHLPAISIVPEMAEQGVLLVLEASLEEQGESLAEMTVKVLDGAYPEAIPVVTPRKTGIVINLRSAQQCELQVPFEVLSQATRVIR